MGQLEYAHLEAREEVETLIEFGLTRQQIEEAGGKLRPPPSDPLAIVKRAGAWANGREPSSVESKDSVTSTPKDV